MRSIQGCTMILIRSEQSGRFLLSRRAHLLTTPMGRWYFLRKPCALRGGCGCCGSLMDNATLLRNCCHCPRSWQSVLSSPNTVAFCYGIQPTASEKHQPDVFHCYGYRYGDTHFLFAKKKQKQKREDGENEWQSTTWKRKL